jgi:hypothetical protein
MKIPPIPKRSDSENEMFHPVFHYALECALTSKGLSSEIVVVRQFKAPGGGLVDIVLLRKSTGKVVLPIELKRTISSVHGAGRRQARDYQLNLTAQSENHFYCVSNLELTELFLSDSLRSTSISQQIKLDSPQDVRLEKNQDQYLLPSLIKVVEEIIDIVILKAKPCQYLVGLSDFEKVLRGTTASDTDWHESIMPFCFEYIRGNSTLKQRTQSWRPASAYKSNPQRLIDLGGSIDFQEIFSPPASKTADFKPQVLQEAFDAGQAFGEGDDLAALVGDILCEPQVGIVETDEELARILAVVAGNVAGDIGDNGCLLDPCAGSGKLLAALIHEKYPQIKPENVIAVEQVPNFAEALSLRLGLQFGNKISSKSCPKIFIAPFESLSEGIFNDTRVAVVNPPFVAGINAVGAKNKLEASLLSHGISPTLGAGQLGLEALFMELVFNMLPENTTIAFIFPFPAISRLSREYAQLRSFLINDMGISHVVTYPSDGVFESVVKKTLIMVCKKGVRPENVELIDIQIRVPDLDLNAFSNALKNPKNGCYGVQFGSVSRRQMASRCVSGWKQMFGIGAEVNAFIAKYAGHKKSLYDYSPDMRRGTVGNSGNTALTVFTKDSIPVKIPNRWMIGCLNNARNMPRFVDADTAPNISFLPPESAFSVGTRNNEKLEHLVADYVMKCKGVFSTKKQKTDVKTPSGIVHDLKKDQRLPATNSIVMPRACREDAKVGVIGNDPILVSTNFLILPVADDEKRILLASWLQSDFGQLQIEMFSTPDEGMRKLEKNALSQVYVPDLDAIPEDVKRKLLQSFRKEPFLSLDDVKPRESDQLWASQLIPKNARYALNEGIRLLKEAYDDRVQ